MRRLVLIAAFIGICSGLRCFVDHRATASVDCGPHSGCIKVSERNITKLNTKSWYSWYVYSPTIFLNFALKIYGNFSLQVRSIYHCAYWNRTETRLLHSPCSRSMFWSRRQIDLLLVHVEWFLQPFCQSNVWFENPLDFRLHCDNNEIKETEFQTSKVITWFTSKDCVHGCLLPPWFVPRCVTNFVVTLPILTNKTPSF